MSLRILYCPVCEKEIERSIGVVSCPNCSSILELQKWGKIILIKRKKFDFWILFQAATGPIFILVYLFEEIFFLEMTFHQIMIIGIILLLYPLIGFLYLGVRGYVDEANMLYALFGKFFRNKLKNEDIGRIIAGYITLISHFIGIVLIVWSIFERIS